MGIGQINNSPENVQQGSEKATDDRAVGHVIEDGQKLADVYEGMFSFVPGYSAMTEVVKGNTGTGMLFAAMDVFGGKLIEEGSSVLLKPLGGGLKNYVAGLFKTSTDAGAIFKSAEASTVKLVRGTNPVKTVVIGQDMERVGKVAAGLKNAETFKPTEEAQEAWRGLLNDYKGKGQIPDDVVKGTKIYKENQNWINGAKAAGYDILDIGAKPGADPSTFYNMETSTVGTGGGTTTAPTESGSVPH